MYVKANQIIMEYEHKLIFKCEENKGHKEGYIKSKQQDLKL